MPFNWWPSSTSIPETASANDPLATSSGLPPLLWVNTGIHGPPVIGRDKGTLVLECERPRRIFNQGHIFAYIEPLRQRKSLASDLLPSVKDTGPANFVICRDRMIASLVRTVKSEGQQALNLLCLGASPKEGKVVSTWVGIRFRLTSSWQLKPCKCLNDSPPPHPVLCPSSILPNKEVLWLPLYKWNKLRDQNLPDITQPVCEMPKSQTLLRLNQSSSFPW